MDGATDPKGTSAFDDPVDLEAAGDVAVGTGEPTGETVSTDQPLKPEDLLPDGLSEQERALLLPRAQAAFDKLNRTVQSRYTKKFQDLARQRQELELIQAELKGRQEALKEVPVATSGQPQSQDPIAYIDSQIKSIVESDNPDPIALMQWTTRKEMAQNLAPLLGQYQQAINMLNERIETLTRSEEEKRLRSNPLYQKYANRVEQEYQRSRGLYSREQLFRMFAAEDLERENQALKSGDVDRARTLMKQQAANVLTPSAPASGSASPPPIARPRGFEEALDAFNKSLPEGKVLDMSEMFSGIPAANVSELVAKAKSGG